MEINKFSPIWSQIIAGNNRLFLKSPEKIRLFYPKNNLFVGLITYKNVLSLCSLSLNTLSQICHLHATYMYIVYVIYYCIGWTISRTGL